jgi:hypothetical protein
MSLTTTTTETRSADRQERFVAMLPEIEQRLSHSFRNLNAGARADAVADGFVACLLAYRRLEDRGRAQKATASTLAWYAALHTRRGRIAGCRLNSKEPLSRYAQLGRRFKVVRLGHRDDDGWVYDMIDSRQLPVADRVAIKLDFTAWLDRLRKRTRNIALDLARGFSASEVGRKYGITASRVSQLRRELKASWELFQGEPALALAR